MNNMVICGGMALTFSLMNPFHSGISGGSVKNKSPIVCNEQYVQWVKTKASIQHGG